MRVCNIDFLWNSSNSMHNKSWQEYTNSPDTRLDTKSLPARAVTMELCAPETQGPWSAHIMMHIYTVQKRWLTFWLRLNLIFDFFKCLKCSSMIQLLNELKWTWWTHTIVAQLKYPRTKVHKQNQQMDTSINLVQYRGKLRLNHRSEMTSPIPKSFSIIVDMGTPA